MFICIGLEATQLLGFFWLVSLLAIVEIIYVVKNITNY